MSSEADFAAGGFNTAITTTTTKTKTNNKSESTMDKTIPTIPTTTSSTLKMTKRQRRKQPNNKNKWLIQHPKIQSMEKREQVYIRDAGFKRNVILTEVKQEQQDQQQEKLQKKQKTTTTSSSSSSSSIMIDPSTTTTSTTTTINNNNNNNTIMSTKEMKFGRLLGGTDQRKRHLAVQKLKEYLRARCNHVNTTTTSSSSPSSSSYTSSSGGISELDLLKLWKALWYTLYMADKKPVQDELSYHIAQLIWCVAGTEEEDEYAGQVYLRMISEEDDEEEEEAYGEDHTSDDDDGDDVVQLEEIENILNENNSSNDDHSSSDTGSNNDGDDDDDDDNKQTNAVIHKLTEGNELVEDVEIPHCRGAHLASLFIRTFFRTIKREWGNMDKYRIDKFYTLIRLMMSQVYTYMAIRHWNLGIIRLFNDAIFDEILSQRPNGLRYHLIDICLDELVKVSSSNSRSSQRATILPLTEATFLDVLEPFLAMCQTGAKDDIVQSRVMEHVMDKFLDKYSVVSDNALRLQNDDDDDDDHEEGATNIDSAKSVEEPNKEDDQQIVIFDQVHVGTIAEFIFDLASDPSTDDKYRKSLYDMHKKYIRRLKKIGKDVELDHNNEDEDNINDDDEDDENYDASNDEAVEQDDDVVVDARDYAKTNITRISTRNNESDKVRHDSTVSKSMIRKRKVTETSADDQEGISVDISQSTPKKRKRKKKKVRDEKSDLKEAEEEEEEEEVVISLFEQRKAKEVGSAKDTKSKKRKNDGNNKAMKSSNNILLFESKKVKFGKVNQCKSHKASMKALLKAIPPKTKERTPDKGILRSPKYDTTTPSPAVLSKKNRIKAVHYF